MRRLMSNLLFENELLSENGYQNRGGKQRCQNKETVSIKIRTISSANSLGTRESIEANPRKSYRYSRVTSRRFTSAHVVSVGYLQSPDLGGMNISTVIPAGGLCRPSVNFLAADRHIHREFSADFLNQIPTDSDLAKWISDCDSFIKEGDLGTNETQVSSVGNEEAPSDRGCNSFGAFGVETLAGNSSTENVDSSGKEVTTSRTVHLRITHTSSLSRKVLR